ncbi:glycoside hydrolase family 3 C-terminal domain-containing protein [Mucilaginibacter daejeonensis]|uniref:glycoside hydrolase family 3 N-terminal domain-containing protein n=1 Tax=Mucilaginibacter daejeonensis TaxID=398049 RepID=UPI001D17634F|nr:glycoside hydrolase family 3 N-terminal domain-containing protein [Mucilaginibacter daejeonensis]UEG54973.1 glycoside hydrolase family 3 C-terminal domain-containing protein [Mucilaginibacter daejeonensis]
MRNKVLLASLCCAFGLAVHGQGSRPFNYFPLSTQDRQHIETLIGQMTVEEKAHQLASFYPNANKRLNIPHMQAGEALHGVVASGTTSLPEAIGLACSWDTVLVERVATAIAREARALGVHQVYTPMLGVVREARWGRFEEAYSEDPFLVSRIGVAFINGLQGRGAQRFDKDHVVATAKHFVGDGEPIRGENGAAVEISLRSLHEVHLPPFRAAVEEAHVGAIMPAHHSLNGVPCHINTDMLVGVLRNTYGFDGLVVSDNNDIRWVQDRFFVTADRYETIRKALEAGVTTELAWQQPWGPKRLYGPDLIAGVKAGAIPQYLLDNSVRKVLQYKYLLRLQQEEFPLGKDMSFMEKGTGSKDDGADVFFSQINASLSSPRKNYLSVLNDKKHDELALEAARRSIVLLQNKNNLLPLKPGAIKNIGVIGPNADTIRLGTYSTQQPKYFVTVRKAIEQMAGNGVQVRYSKGTDIQNPKPDQIEEALNIARQSDVNVLVLGDDAKTVMENIDRDDISLPGQQQQLLERVAALGKPVILVLIHGRPPAIQWAKDHVGAILDGWFLGQNTGTAVAEAIFGKINPSGKLTVTYPRNVGQTPSFYNSLAPGRPRELWQAAWDPTFAFGYGISYTQFKYTDLHLSQSSMTDGETVYAQVTVTNTGKMKGDEIVQLYVHDELSSLTRPAKELKGFARVTLEPGQSKQVSIPITRRALEFWKDGQWITEGGKFTVMVGPNSTELTYVTLTLNK